MDEHPGGDEVILAEGGQDATEAFEDVGHSDEARALLPGMLVGEFEKGSVRRLRLILSFNLSHLFPLLQSLKLKSGAAAAQESRVSGAVESGSKYAFSVPPFLFSY